MKPEIPWGNRWCCPVCNSHEYTWFDTIDRNLYSIGDHYAVRKVIFECGGCSLIFGDVEKFNKFNEGVNEGINEGIKMSVLNIYKRLENGGFIQACGDTYAYLLEPGASIILEFAFPGYTFRKCYKLQEKAKVMAQAEKIKEIIGDEGTVKLYEESYKLLNTF